MINNVMNYNEQIRKKIADDLENIIVDKYCKLEEAIDSYQEYLYNMIDGKDDKKKVYQGYLCGIVYLDAYKIYSYKFKKLIATPIEIDVFKQLLEISDYDDLKASISSNPTLFKKMIEASYYFSEAAPLSKIMLTKSLSKEENQKLSTITSVSEIDLDTYNKNVDIQTLINNYIYQKKYFESVMSIDFEDGIVLSAISFIKDLSLISKDNVDKLLRDLILLDMKICRYFNIDDNVTNIYDNTSLIKVINYLLNDMNMLKVIVQRIMDVYVNRKYNGIDIDDDTIKLIKK